MGLRRILSADQLRAVALWATLLAVCLRMLLPGLHHHGDHHHGDHHAGLDAACGCGAPHADVVLPTEPLLPTGETGGQQHSPAVPCQDTACAACQCEQSSPGGALPEPMQPRGQTLRRLTQRPQIRPPAAQRRPQQHHSRAPPVAAPSLPFLLQAPTA